MVGQCQQTTGDLRVCLGIHKTGLGSESVSLLSGFYKINISWFDNEPVLWVFFKSGTNSYATKEETTQPPKLASSQRTSNEDVVQ